MHETPFIDIHTHHSDHTDGVLSIVNYYPEQTILDHVPDQYITVGLHPWKLEQDCADKNLELVKTIAPINKVLAIGEIGLDRTVASPLHIQETYFIKQITIAEKLQKPIIIHCVRCFPELLSIKKKVKASTPWLIHGFRNNIQIANNLLEHGCYLSFGEALLFDKKIQDIFVQMPINRIFLETDESKCSIVDIYNKAVQLKNIQIEELKKSLFENYMLVFQS